MTPDGQGSHVMIVEDDAFIAFDLQRCLVAAGYAVVGPFPTLDAGEGAVDRERIDFAVLDVNLAGTFVYPLADLLGARKIPFLLVTGYAPSDIPPRFHDRPVCRKPCVPEQIVSTLTSMGATRTTGIAPATGVDGVEAGRAT